MRDGDDVRALIAEARAEARERARRILADELTETLLADARAALAPPPSGVLAWYVFGVVAAGGAQAPDDTELVVDGDLAAVAARVPLDEYGEQALRENLNDMAWLERAARRHEAVLDALLRATTVIPLRLCTIYRSEDAVREMLAAERAELHEALERLAGHSEWGVKAFCDRRTVAGGTGESAGEEGLGAGGAYLARRRHEAKARERADALVERCADEAHGELAAAAREALLNPLQRRELTGRDDDMVLNGVYLLRDTDVEAFREAAEAIAARAPEGIGFELTGPWPPYNFVKHSIEAAR